MPPPDIKPTSEIQALTQRELHLNKEASDLRELLAGKRSQLEKIVASESLPERLGLTRIPFATRKTPQDTLKSEISQITEAIKSKASEWKAVKCEIENKLEDFLLRVDPSFTRACRTFGIISECRAILVNLRNRTTDYLPRLGELRASLSAGYNTQAATYTQNTYEQITAAAQAGLLVDAAIFKLQEREYQISEILEGSIIDGVPFPEFHPLNLGDLTESLKNRLLDDAHQTVQQILLICERAIQKQCPAYEKGLTQAEITIRDACLAYIDSYWQSLRRQIWQKLHQVSPMPRRRSMSETNPAIPIVNRPASDEISQEYTDSTSSAEDSGKGFTNDFYIRSGVRRSSLKLRR